jgi:hypothetical protein
MKLYTCPTPLTKSIQNGLEPHNLRSETLNLNKKIHGKCFRTLECASTFLEHDQKAEATNAKLHK